MECEECYKHKHCWACVKWFGCSKDDDNRDCFKCDRIQCPKENK